MNPTKLKQRSLLALSVLAAMAGTPVMAEAMNAPAAQPDEIEEVTVVGRSVQRQLYPRYASGIYYLTGN